jgi:hypothetical protein
MNKRIEELAEQAVEEMDQEAFSEDMYIPEEWIQKFAELIVRECMEQASIGNMGGNNQWDKALTFAADNIKKHFGVEE